MSKTFKTREFSRRQYSFQSELGAEESEIEKRYPNIKEWIK